MTKRLPLPPPRGDGEGRRRRVSLEGGRMSEKDTTYNGWTNYETWAVALWIDNDQYTAERAREMTREIGDEPRINKLTGRDQTAYELGHALREWVEEEMLPALGDASLQADLLGAAVSEVNWQEIAENYLSDVAA